MAGSQKSSRSKITCKKGSSSGKDIQVDEMVEIFVNLYLERFRYSDDKEMEFPSSLTSTERAFVHREAQSLGFISVSKGTGSKRFLTLRKKEGVDTARIRTPLSLSRHSQFLIRSLLQRYPISTKGGGELPAGSRSSVPTPADSDACDRSRASGRLNHGVPKVPRRRIPTELDAFRSALPVSQQQEEILALIRENRVVLVLGETGSGKTTQIPQFLLDESSREEEPCRIFCTQPRRLAAISVAERVAAERGECVGKTVGYHIRLESRVSPKTCLTFCTTGVFLRTLMAGDASLTTVTHIIVDEVHERDGLTDFLLIKLRDVLPKIPTLKLILSSASLDVELFRGYFGNCPVIKLKGRQFEVKQMFLEDVLRLTGFNGSGKKMYSDDVQRMQQREKQLTDWCRAVERRSAVDESRHRSAAQDRETMAKHPVRSEQVEPWIQKEMDSCISRIFLHDEEEAFPQLFNLILHESVSVDYQHSEAGSSPLMVAAGRGFVPQMKQLLSLGADINSRASNGWTALDFAERFQQIEAADLLRSSIPLTATGVESSQVQAGGTPGGVPGLTSEEQDPGLTSEEQDPGLTSEEQDLLNCYQHSVSEERVDLDLIMDLLTHLFTSTADGAVLIFLPGYDEIVTLRERIYDDTRLQPNRYQVFTLHSDMQTSDQKKAMKPSTPGVRKIVLSTNIAETSITISDVVFVIDSGKVKQKSFDAISRVSMLKTVWISHASALQRRGRAGRCRPGICFHLFSRLRFKHLLEFTVPQLLRMPLQEVCLQSKLLTPSSVPVVEFLSKAPEPPPAHAIRNAVHQLQSMGALDHKEELTDLGFFLADLPVEPHLGKMVLCAVALKCLDPVLTIACTLAYRDPFILPAASSHKHAALHARKHFSANTYSDHMGLLRAFQAWQRSQSEGCERSFCQRNFVSQASMETILGMRTQLLGQLRAIGFVRARGGSDIRDVNQNSENWAVVKAALLAGMSSNILHLDQNRDQKIRYLDRDQRTRNKLHFHPTSVLGPDQEGALRGSASRTPPTDWLIYDEMSRSHRTASVRCCSTVTPITAAIFRDGAKPSDTDLQGLTGYADLYAALIEDSDSEGEDVAEVKVNDWLLFQTDSETAGLVTFLSMKWSDVFMRRISCPSKAWSQQDEATIRTLVSVLTAEEQEAGLQQPTGIGQRPRPMTSSDTSSQVAAKSTKTTPPPTLHLTGVCAFQVLQVCVCLPRSGRCAAAAGSNLKSQRREEASCDDSAILDSQSVSPVPSSSGQVSSSVRYFIMKSSNPRNIEISQQKGIWSTTLATQERLSRAFTNTTVILFFSVQGSGHFQGFGRMSSPVNVEGCQDWGLLGLGGVFRVDWIQTQRLPFTCSQHILNPWNENKKVQISRDGQELEPQAGRELLLLWERISSAQ